MNILGVVPSYPPESMVGSWLTTAVFLEDLANRGHQVEVVAYRGQWRSYQHRGVTVHVGAGNIESKIPAADVVISHLGDNRRAARACVQHGKPNVRMAHGHGTDPDRMAGAALVVFNSHSFAERVDCPAPHIVAHPPVHEADYRTDPGDHVTLINLTKDKGVLTFWKAAEQLPHRKFLGVRGGYGNQTIPRAGNVETVATQRDMRTVYSRTRILLMPSKHETYGRCAVEAAASGIPTIAHPTPGLREALGDAGIWIHHDDIAGWVDAIERLHDPAEWRHASQAALEQFAAIDTRADLDRFATAVEALMPVPA